MLKRKSTWKGFRPRRPAKGSTLRQQGKKTRAWAKERRKLKGQSVKDGLTTCQLRYPGCTVNDFLSYAHPRKRRHLKDGEIAVAILACWNCHNTIERKPEDEMSDTVYEKLDTKTDRMTETA